jgi:sarcosine oxidase subunit alpha
MQPTASLVDRARTSGITVEPATTVCDTAGRLRVRSVDLAPVADGTVGTRRRVECDLLLMCGGVTPTIHLFSQSRGRARYEAVLQAFVPDQSAVNEISAGAARGVFDLAAAVADGYAVGEIAAARIRSGGSGNPAPARIEDKGGFIGAMPGDRPPTSVRAFVDFQNDVTAKDVKLAVQEGFRSIEHIKRYTTTGMATDQGKTSNLNALGIAAAALGTDVPTIGHTTFRNPYTPVTFGTLAGFARGQMFDPVRTTPTHAWAVERGAVFEDVGQWKRAHYFPLAGETMHDAVARECRAVRGQVGIFDASTLGKIEVVGPDAAEFMNRIYVNPWTKLAVGRCRYGLMLREDGFVMDDGVVGRVAADRFHVTTTTGGAAGVLQHMEDYLQTSMSG